MVIYFRHKANRQNYNAMQPSGLIVPAGSVGPGSFKQRHRFVPSAILDAAPTLARPIFTTSTSPNGTTIPPATQIVDGSSNVWTVTGGVVYQNGVAAGYSANVTLLLYFGGSIYQQNNVGSWYAWNGTTWVDSSDPRTGPNVPTITSISQVSGPLSGGTTVIIYGTNFTGATAVKFGTVNATSFTVNSATQITSVSPAETAGTVDITVTTPAGTSATSANDRFTYTSGGGQTIVISDQSQYNQWSQTPPNGQAAIPWWAWNSQWGASGISGWQTFTIHTDTFPWNSRIDWDWGGGGGGGILAYPMLCYGTYSYYGVPLTTITPRQCNNINQLMVHHDVTWGGDTAHFDVMYDFYLSNVAGPPTTGNNGVFEVEIYAHMPPFIHDWLYVGGGVNFPKAYFTDAGGHQWTLALNVQGGGSTSGMLIFYRTDAADMPIYDVDIKGMFTAAKNGGLMTGNEWFIGLGLGAEPNASNGYLVFNNMSVTYS